MSPSKRQQFSRARRRDREEIGLTVGGVILRCEQSYKSTEALVVVSVWSRNTRVMPHRMRCCVPGIGIQVRHRRKQKTGPVKDTEVKQVYNDQLGLQKHDQWHCSRRAGGAERETGKLSQ